MWQFFFNVIDFKQDNSSFNITCLWKSVEEWFDCGSENEKITEVTKLGTG